MDTEILDCRQIPALDEHRATVIIIDSDKSIFKAFRRRIKRIWGKAENIGHVKYIILHVSKPSSASELLNAAATAIPPHINSKVCIRTLIQEEFDIGILPDFIYVIGFRHGAGVALSAGRESPRLAGIGCCSPQVSLINQLWISEENAIGKLPIFVSHYTARYEYLEKLVGHLTEISLDGLHWNCYE